MLGWLSTLYNEGDHPKTAEAIARKINLILGETRESLSAKTGRPIEEIYDDETSAVVVHGDDIDSLEGWQWDQSARSFGCGERHVLKFFSSPSFQQAGNCLRSYYTQT